MTTSKTLWTFAPESAAGSWQNIDLLPTITIGAGGETESWPAVQPGVLDETGNYVAHRIVVLFDVPETARAVLDLQFSSERGPCPDLEIVVDGIHRGVFHPVVIRDDRTATGEPGPTAGPVHLRVPLPAAWLPAGAHSISVTTVLDEAAALGDRDGVNHDVRYRSSEHLPAARAHYGNWFGCYIRWSSASLVLTDELEPGLPAAPSVVLSATPLFIDTDRGEAELVDCDLSWEAGTPLPGSIELDWGTEVVQVPAIPPGRDFGMFRWRFPAPPFSERTTVRFRVGEREGSQEIVPARKWQLHLVPHVHLDLGFTDAQGKVLELHCRNIDRALTKMEEDPRFRFAVDGSAIMQEYERTRSRGQVERMRRAITRGALGVNAFHSNLLTGVVSLEELYRSMDYSLTLPVSEVTSIRYANLTDVPTYSRAIPSVLSHLGIDGFVGMANHGRAATDTSDELHLMSPVRWQGPDGSEVLAHFADHYSQLRFIAADPQSLVGATNGLGRYLARYERSDYLPNDLAVIGTHADNEDLADGDTGFVDRWNEAFAWPRFRVSTFDEYLSSVAPLRDRLPVWKSESGSYWEDGVGSAASDFASYRRTQALLPAAETFGALVAASYSAVTTNRVEFDRAWNDLAVAAEHTLTWSRSTSHPHAFPVQDQLGWKRRYIEDAHRVAIDEMRRHAAQLAELVDVAGPGFLAWNPHSWTTDLEAEIDLADGIDLLDADGIMPFELISSCGGMRRLRVRLPAMPPHSWRFLPMTAGLLTLPGGDASPAASTALAVAANDLVHQTDAGVITSPGWVLELDDKTRLPRSLRHRPTGRELLDPSSSVRLGQIIRTGEKPFSETDAEWLARPPAVHGHQRGRTLSIENFRYIADPPRSDLISESPILEFDGYRETFDGIRVRWSGSGAGIDGVVVELLLRNDSAMCDLDVRFVKQPCLDMEAIYVAFPFAGSNPVVRYDRQLGWVNPSSDHGPGASNEWGALTNTVSIDTDEGEILWTALDAPLFAVGDVVRGAWPTSFPANSGAIFSYAMNNYWPCNTPPVQSGEAGFSYRVGITEGFDAAQSSRFGRIARVDAQLSEILPLDRYRPDTPVVYRAGVLAALGGDSALDVKVVETKEKEAVLCVTNLGEEPLSTLLTLPGDYRIAEGSSHAGGTVRVELAGFGVQRVALACG
ncbi:hypothetical protein [Glaciihabitans sp. UYNi722]|uniref:glycoside hydrolase family 38 N-terminal domain-containing protein n=1 Tax=Glaciihabitans sp. UYNi722 TaxID=3156344 RepID=UPI003396F41A